MGYRTPIQVRLPVGFGLYAAAAACDRAWSAIAFVMVMQPWRYEWRTRLDYTQGLQQQDTMLQQHAA